MKRRPIPTSVYRAVIDEAEGHCEGCGEPSDRLEVDHIRPVVFGGGNERSNLRALGPCCHRPKSRRETREYAKAERIRRKHEAHLATMSEADQ